MGYNALILRGRLRTTRLPGIIGPGVTALAVAVVASLHGLVYARSVQAQERDELARDRHAITTATYELVFESTWSAVTHPSDFPPNPHFSGLIGAAHDASASFWTAGEIASDGIESMAETGSKTLLQNEIVAAVGTGGVQNVISGGGISVSPGSVSVTFDVTTDYPLVTVVSMLAPSPDWFVGADGLSLMEEGSWAEQIVVPLVVHDAGSDSGTSYASANADTDPPEVISALTSPPFDNSNMVGTFTFSLLTVVSSDPVPEAACTTVCVSSLYPNPTSGAFRVTVVVDRSQTVNATLYDVAGRRVHVGGARRTEAGFPVSFHIDTSGLAEDIYLLRVSGPSFNVVRKVVLMRP